ncbi:MAG: nuclear transport factor 2 family protein [Nevskiaceae bacterium]|nr:MAG: nuclear transport factor 2 family protein [Nevskiaceae bacterium]
MSLPLEDIELIRRLKYAYCRCIDTANLDELKTLFTEDASVRYQGGSYLFEAQGRDKILEALRYAFHAEAIAMHHVNHPEIDFVSPTEATGVWYLKDWFLDLKHKIITDGTALYRDTYVKQNGRWLIKRATYERIYEIVTPVTETPNITAHYLARHAAKQPG